MSTFRVKGEKPSPELIEDFTTEINMYTENIRQLFSQPRYQSLIAYYDLGLLIAVSGRVIKDSLFVAGSSKGILKAATTLGKYTKKSMAATSVADVIETAIDGGAE